jgi:hypothetical protein
MLTFRSSLPGIPDHRAPSALRGKPHPQDLPHAHFCAQRGRRQVKVLVLPRQAPQDQEGERRDRLCQPGSFTAVLDMKNLAPTREERDEQLTFSDPREAPPEGQELRYLDPLRFALRHPQHVQGVPRDVPCRRRRCALPGYGRPSPISLQVGAGTLQRSSTIWISLTVPRSSRLLRSRSPTTSAAHTSSSSLSRDSSSLCPTASTRRPARRSSLPSARQLSSKRVSLSGVRSGWTGIIWVSLGYASFTKEVH